MGGFLEGRGGLYFKDPKISPTQIERFSEGRLHHLDTLQGIAIFGLRDIPPKKPMIPYNHSLPAGEDLFALEDLDGKIEDDSAGCDENDRLKTDQPEADERLSTRVEDQRDDRGDDGEARDLIRGAGVGGAGRDEHRHPDGEEGEERGQPEDRCDPRRGEDMRWEPSEEEDADPDEQAEARPGDDQ